MAFPATCQGKVGGHCAHEKVEGVEEPRVIHNLKKAVVPEASAAS